MALLVCDICGGKIKVQPGGQEGLCESCGASYTMDRMREITSGVNVNISGTDEDVKRWKVLLRTAVDTCDFKLAEQTVQKILGAAPTDEYAKEIYTKLLDWRSYEIRNGFLVKYHGQAQTTEVPPGVREIGEEAFLDCVALTEITLPDGLECIGDAAFYHCAKLTDVSFPPTLKQIGARAFSGTALTEINLPEGFEKIGPCAFERCPIRALVFPSSLRNIDGFSSCWLLTSIVIPEGVFSICDSAFKDCRYLTSVVIGEGVYSIADRAFASCNSLKDITLPESLHSIGCNAFHSCTALQRIRLPSGVTYMSEYPFYYSGLRAVQAPKTLMKNFQHNYNFKGCRYCYFCGGNLIGLGEAHQVCCKCGQPKYT